jgi:hypothetical protein
MHPRQLRLDRPEHVEVELPGEVGVDAALEADLQAEELAEANAFRSLRKPRVPVKLIEPVPDDTLRRLLGLASVRDRAILLRALRARFAEHPSAQGRASPGSSKEGGQVQTSDLPLDETDKQPFQPRTLPSDGPELSRR